MLDLDDGGREKKAPINGNLIKSKDYYFIAGYTRKLRLRFSVLALYVLYSFRM